MNPAIAVPEGLARRPVAGRRRICGWGGDVNRGRLVITRFVIPRRESRPGNRAEDQAAEQTGRELTSIRARDIWKERSAGQDGRQRDSKYLPHDQVPGAMSRKSPS